MNPILGAANAVRWVLGRAGAGNLLRVLKFDAAAVTIIPQGAKRNGGGPFAAGPLVQGKADSSGTPDVVALPTLTAVVAPFYNLLDFYQGSIVFWITPEWAGSDELEHDIFFAGEGYFRIFKTASNNLQLTTYQGSWRVLSVSVSGWTAGATYCVVIRWDAKNTLDGTNYACVSINDVHTFGVTANGTPTGAVTGNWIGSNYATQHPANAIIEGFTIYRRVLDDGTYGVNVGNGDELAQLYNAGAGKDPTEITGSFDATLCIPTNATPGALVTGTGEAWSQPHGSEALTDAFCQTAYADSAWDDAGTPVTPTSVAFNGTSTAIDCGSEASIDDLHDGAFTAETWIRPNGRGGDTLGCVFSKTYWRLAISDATSLQALVFAATSNGTGSAAIALDGRWYHVAVFFDDAGDRKPYIAIDGIWITTGQIAAVGSVTSDAAQSLFIGNSAAGDRAWQGAMGWTRISNNARYTPGTNFTPPARTSPPANDANTVRLFYLNEGTGTTITDYSTNAQNGTLANGTWNVVKDMATDEPGARVYQWGYGWGNDAADEGITQTLSGLTAGADYVLRPVLHYDANAVPIIKVLDATNSDAEITSLTCPNQQTNLVTNGGFDSDTTGWTAGASASLSSVAGGVSGNALQVENGAASQGYAHQAIQITPYAIYRLTWWHKNGTALGKVSVGTSAGGTQVYSGSNTNDAAWAQYTTVFNAGTTGLVYVNLWQGSATNGQNTLYDSITLTRVVDSKRPFCPEMMFELPTVARHGVASDCVAVKVQVLNTATTGVIGLHQLEML